jgi:peptidyl-prolyl cis-trans isomerase C
MTRIQNKFCSVTLWRIIALLTLSILLLGGDATAMDKTIAKVNGTELTEFDLQDELQNLYPRSFFHGTSSNTKRDALRPKALKNIIENELLYQEAKMMKLKADKKLIDNIQKKAIRRYGGKKAFKSVLKQRALTKKQYRKTIEKNLLVQMIIESEVKQKSKVTNEDVAKYYEENKKTYVRPVSRRLWHVLIKVNPVSTAEDRLNKKKMAEKVLKMTKEEGADLFQIAWDFSDGSHRVKGGDLGFIHKGSLERPVNEAAFSLELGQTSEVVESIFGYHIVKVLEIKEPTQLSLQDVSQKIRRKLENRNLTQKRDDLISRLREEAVIEVYEEVAED